MMYRRAREGRQKGVKDLNTPNMLASLDYLESALRSQGKYESHSKLTLAITSSHCGLILLD